MKVICINGDFTNSENEYVKNILKVGDDGIFPKENEVYEVIGYGHFANGEDAYELEGLEDSTPYGCKLLFSKSRFKIFDDSFIPNSVVDGVLCRKANMYLEMKFDIPDGVDLPEGGMTFVYKKK